MFCGVTKDDIQKSMAQWQVDGEISGDADISPTGCFYLESQSECQSALIQGGFPDNLTAATPIAMEYMASIHRNLTMLLYIQSRRINIATDGSDPTRGLWGSIRRKLAAISKGEPFGELRAPTKTASTASFYCAEPVFGDFSPNRGL